MQTSRSFGPNHFSLKLRGSHFSHSAFSSSLSLTPVPAISISIHLFLYCFHVILTEFSFIVHNEGWHFPIDTITLWVSVTALFYSDVYAINCICIA